MTDGRLSILLVEDEPEIAEEIAGFLRRRNFHVHTAPDFGSARRALAATDGWPDVLVTDVNLPDGDGLGLLHDIARRSGSKPRVIVMTGHLNAEKVEQAQRDGAETVLLKPFALSKLLSQLREPHS